MLPTYLQNFRRSRAARTGATTPATAAAQAKVSDLHSKVVLAQSYRLAPGVVASLQRQLVCAQADLARALGLAPGVIASLDGQCHPALPVRSETLPTPPPLYPATWQPDVIRSSAGASAVPGDAVRIQTNPLSLEVGGSSLQPSWLYQYGRALHGNSPVTAVDLSIANANGNRLHAAVIAWLYGNGEYQRPVFRDNGDRPWADIDRSQIVHVWRNNVLIT